MQKGPPVRAEQTRIRPTPYPCHTQLTNATQPRLLLSSGLVLEACVDRSRDRWTARPTMVARACGRYGKVALSQKQCLFVGRTDRSGSPGWFLRGRADPAPP